MGIREHAGHEYNVVVAMGTEEVVEFVDDLGPKVACGIQKDVVREMIDGFL
jgi:hypothetical protein